MERKLASVQQVLAINPIPNADAIERATVLGWDVVAKKEEFKPGDLCVFFEIDSFLPDLPVFQFVRRGKTGPSSLRLRTIKLKGVVSQGLALPLAAALEIQPELKFQQIGEDLTEALGVRLWDDYVAEMESKGGVPGVLRSRRASDFPSYLKRTDEARIQSEPRLLEELAGKPYYVSLKMDGSSGTYAHHDEPGFVVCSRNFVLKRPEPEDPQPGAWWVIAAKYQLEQVLAGKNLALQGEVCGPGIQGNKVGLKELELFVFNVYDIKTRQNLDLLAAQKFCVDHGLRFVDVIEQGESFAYDKEQLLKLAEGKYPGTKNEREGIVVRPLTETFSPTLGGRLSFKVISNVFLLKGGE